MTGHVRGSLSIMLAAILWGVAGTAAKYFFANQNLPPFLLVQVRLGLSSLLLLVGLLVVTPQLARIRRTDMGFFAVWGVLGMAMVQFSYLFTISQTNVATAIFLQYTSPILTALYAWLVGRERLGNRLIAILAVAMAGLVLLISGGTTRMLVSPLGLATGIASAGFLSFYTIYAKKVSDRLSSWTLLGYGLGVGFLFFLIVDVVLALTGHPLAGTEFLARPSMWLFFIYLASLATIAPFGLYLAGLKWVSAVQANITAMLEPVVGGITAYAFLGEVLRPMQLLGGALIVVAVLLLQVGDRKKGAA